MQKVTATDPRVINFFNQYHKKVKSNPNLYTNKRDGSRAFLVTLPATLLDYAERGAGHSGFGADARPVGIRRVVDDAKVALAAVFSSTTTLSNFINSSKCDGHEYVAEVKIRHAKQATVRSVTQKSPTIFIDSRPAKDHIVTKYGFPLVQSLVVKYGRPIVEQAHHNLTVNEYELRFGL